MIPLEFYKQFIGSEDLVFDVGANIGERSAIFAQLARKVIAVEPVAESFLALSQLASEKVFPIHAAVASNTNPVKIYSSKEVPTLQTASMNPEWCKRVQTSGRFQASHWTTTQMVIATTLDRLITTYGEPAFIKIDVEGAELEVLSGLSQSVKALSFEWHPEVIEDSCKCVDRCVELGMKQFAVSERETLELTPWENSEDAKAYLRMYTGNIIFGDVYARC